jgi:hypothetical protein
VYNVRSLQKVIYSYVILDTLLVHIWLKVHFARTSNLYLCVSQKNELLYYNIIIPVYIDCKMSTIHAPSPPKIPLQNAQTDCILY